MFDYLWSCIICRNRVSTNTDFHINDRPICVQCNAEMEPYQPGVTPLPENEMNLTSQLDTFTGPSGGLQ